ncbi:MAG: hypothetical protein ACREA0_24030, partial [bacterium]
PVGEPHSYENLDTESPGKELAFYGMIPHRRLADTTFFDDHWVKEGKVIKADMATTEQTIDPRAWKPSFSRGKVTLFKSSEAQADRSFLEPAAVRWLVTRDTCNTEELLAGLVTLAPQKHTGRKQNLGAEMMLFLFKGTLEVRDWLGHPYFIGPESFVYFPKGTAWSIGNPDMWDEAEFFLSYGGINAIDATGLVAA